MESFFRQFGLPMILVLVVLQIALCAAGMLMPLDSVEPAHAPQKVYGTQIKVIWEGEIVPRESNELAANTAVPSDF